MGLCVKQFQNATKPLVISSSHLNEVMLRRCMYFTRCTNIDYCHDDIVKPNVDGVASGPQVVTHCEKMQQPVASSEHCITTMFGCGICDEVLEREETFLEHCSLHLIQSSQSEIYAGFE